MFQRLFPFANSGDLEPRTSTTVNLLLAPRSLLENNVIHGRNTKDTASDALPMRFVSGRLFASHATDHLPLQDSIREETRTGELRGMHRLCSHPRLFLIRF